VVDLPDLVPFQLRRVFDRYEPRTFRKLAAAHRVQPVTIAPIFSGAFFVWRQSDYTLRTADSLHFQSAEAHPSLYLGW
jgi:hypothetical protein